MAGVAVESSPRGSAAQRHAVDVPSARVNDALSFMMNALKRLSEHGAEGPVPKEVVSHACQTYLSFCRQLNDIIGVRSGLPKQRREELGKFVGDRLASCVALGASGNRWKTKPRGYAGDNVSLQMIYDRIPQGDNHLAKAIDALFLTMPSTEAVRARRKILCARIESTYKAVGGQRPVCIMAMAAGPAAELFDAWGNLGRPGDLHAYLLDGDPQAIEALQHRSMELSAESAVKSTKLCAAASKVSLAKVALGKITVDAPKQDVVYSLGLADYLDDTMVVKLLNVAYDLLHHGGVVIVGNFHESNPDQACLDHILDWKLIHRSEADMHRLMRQSRFGAQCEEIIRDATGIQLLAVGRKPLASCL